MPPLKFPSILLYRRALCFQFFLVLDRYCIFLIFVNDPLLADCLQICKRCIRLDRIAQDQSVTLAVLGYVCDLMMDRIPGIFQMDFLSIQKQLAADIRSVALSENTLSQLSTAGSPSVRKYQLLLLCGL